MKKGTLQTARAELAEGLRARRREMLEAVAGRAMAIDAPTELTPSDYREGLQEAISAAVDFGIASVESSAHGFSAEVPLTLLSQAQLAARSNMSLETVIRRYVAGFTLFEEFVFDAAEAVDGLTVVMLRNVMQLQSQRFDRLIDMVSDEYRRGREIHQRISGNRIADQLERLLVGEPIDTSNLAYDLDGCHLGIVAAGPQAARTLRRIARSLDSQMVHIDRGDATVWAWLGRGAPIDPQRVESLFHSLDEPALRIAVGEASGGRDGWRLSHRQACAAWSVALRSGADYTRYIDVALPAAMLQDGLLATSMRDLYLVPLESTDGAGSTLKETLRVYFSVGGNSSSTAAALKVSRQTVKNRLRSAEELLGRRLEDCAAELGTALKYDALCSGWSHRHDVHGS